MEWRRNCRVGRSFGPRIWRRCSVTKLLVIKYDRRLAWLIHWSMRGTASHRRLDYCVMVFGILLIFITACRKCGRFSRRQRFIKKCVNNLVTSTSTPPFRSDDRCTVQISTCNPLSPNSTATTDVCRSPKTLGVAIEPARSWLRIHLYRARGCLRRSPLFPRRWFSRVYIPMCQNGASFWRISTWPVPEFASLFRDWNVTVESSRCEDGRAIRQRTGGV